ncbi:MAG TPA: 4-hydroxy-3-methylbut-2-enyl diphosphate reductase [Deltaproteobacteria bacterium]|nr:4-hydroxy-3-methylbut-2-enyl diphosphate reductase [Deltaproteobacteria bacterium]
MIEVIKTKNCGFCFGVRRAVKAVLKERGRTTGPIYTLGPLLHNPQVVQELVSQDIVPVSDVRSVKSGTIAYRSHGILREEEEYIGRQRLSAIDLVCPFVKRVRKCAMLLRKEGYRVVIVGDPEHPEVKSVLSYLDNDGIVLQNPSSIESSKVGVVSQTTQDQATYVDIVQGLVGKAEELRAFNTICDSTRSRKEEAVALAARVDVMLVVGGRNSANTTKLFHLVEKAQPNSHHIETDEELKPEWFAGVTKVGVTGGTSTPDSIIEKVEKRVKNF